ncbi:uncharacterized protein LOC113337806 [Papaver somniferum]|uniref:uncharacterized protein LOC113337806 n=1 Tax=Papaver somniferum TaxID=3469 RepID=UPI000E703689|nr:uncharacterized protein LOC113337806 [Papaver somniferum]
MVRTTQTTIASSSAVANNNNNTNNLSNTNMLPPLISSQQSPTPPSTHRPPPSFSFQPPQPPLSTHQSLPSSSQQPPTPSSTQRTPPPFSSQPPQQPPFTATSQPSLQHTPIQFPSKSMLRSQLHSIKKESSTIYEFLHQIKTIADLLAEIGEPVQDSDLVMYTLNGIGKEFIHFVKQVIDYGDIPCQICHKDGHWANRYGFRYSASRNSTAPPQRAFLGLDINAGSSSTSPWSSQEFDSNVQFPSKVAYESGGYWSLSNSGPIWILDSGASSHMKNDASILQNTTLHSGPEQVMVGDGKLIPISLTGSSTLSTSSNHFNLHKVIYVPHLQHNLMFVAQFTKENNCVFLFYPWGYEIKSLKSNLILARERMKDGLYPILYGHSSSHNASP